MKLLLLPLFVLLLLPGFVFSQTPPNLDCADISIRDESSYKAAVYDLTPCDDSYKFSDLQNKTARQIVLGQVREVCAEAPDGVLISGGPNISECRFNKTTATSPKTQTAVPQSASGGKVYSPLVNIPGNQAGGFEQYISFLYGASISIAALLAVVKIIIAGAKYMLSDVITNKGEAIKDIQGAILGLLLILGAVIILEFINPQLIKNNIQFQPIPKRPDIAIAGTNAVIAAKQNSELTEGLSNCVSSATGIGTSGNKNVTTIDINKCPTADLQRSNYTIFKNNCEEANPPGQIARTGEEGSEQYRCAVSIRGKTFSIDGYKADADCGVICDTIELIDNATYVKKDGRIVTYDATKFCQEKYPKINLDGCKDAVGDAFTSSESLQNSTRDSYCENNGGKILGRFSCQLPANTLTIGEARDISKTSINNQEQFETFCKTQFDGAGIFVDTGISDRFDLADKLCVKY